MNASFLEIVQTLMAGLGASMTIVSKINADRNMVAVKRLGANGIRLLIAQKNSRAENIILAVQLGLFFGGLWSLFLAPPPYDAIPFDQPSAVAKSIRLSVFESRLAMTWASLWLLYLSYRNWIDLTPLRVTRKTDDTVTNPIVPGEVVKTIQVVADDAQQVADKAQIVATDVQIEADKESELIGQKET